ncbi:MAG: AMP-binding protein [Lachnospiraceae bacterium]|nr:AMP-binding protein [Lachnospiraceae bacterium]
MSANEHVNTLLNDVASRVKEMRELSGISVHEMAESTNMSIEEYLALEEGKIDFTFSFIYKCAEKFGVDIADILQGSSPKLTSYSVVRKGKGVPIAGGDAYNYLNMAPNFKNKMGEPFFCTLHYDPEKANEPIPLHVHKGQEVTIITKGMMKHQFGNRIETLSAGDVIYFDSTTPHGELAANGQDCEFFTVIMKPEGESLSDDIFMKETNWTPENVIQDEAETGVVCEKYVKTKIDGNGLLKEIKFKHENTFNFAYDIVDAIAEKDPDRLAMLFVADDKSDRRFTFKDISELSSKAANYFRSLGIQKGDRVMLVLKRHYQFWVSIVALHKLGAIAIPATSQLVKHDFEYRFNAAGVSAIVCTPSDNVPEQVDLAQPACPTLVKKIIVKVNKDNWDYPNKEGWNYFDEEMEQCSKDFARPQGSAGACGDDLMLMFFTSGTTGYPKIATHSYKYALGHFITAKYWHNVKRDGLHLTISDTGWGKALWGKLYGAWMNEAAVMVYDFERFNAADMLPMFAKYNITTFCAPPTIFRFLIKEDLSKYDLSSIQYGTTAGEALNREVYDKFLEATGISLMEGFGQTETTLVLANLVGSKIKPGSMGKPSPLYDVDLQLPDGTSASVGEVGEIVIKTDKNVPCGLFRGYYRDDEKTLDVWNNGVYHTGDTAWRDEDGYFWYVGRTDDLIKSSGYRIGPFEIESVIMELPYILECAVTAAPDPIRGQVVKATIVLTKGTVGTDELKKEIQTYVKVNTAPYKYPRIVEFVEELPKTISGKIRRVALRDANK